MMEWDGEGWGGVGSGRREGRVEWDGVRRGGVIWMRSGIQKKRRSPAEHLWVFTDCAVPGARDVTNDAVVRHFRSQTAHATSDARETLSVVACDEHRGRSGPKG